MFREELLSVLHTFCPDVEAVLVKYRLTSLIIHWLLEWYPFGGLGVYVFEVKAGDSPEVDLNEFVHQGCGSRFHPVFCRDSYGAYNLSGTSSQSRGSIVAAAGSAVAITPDFLFDRWQ